MRRGLPTLADVLSLGTGVALSLVVSLDGQLCGPDGSSRSISGPEDLQWLRTLRAAADVIVVGAATAARERYGAISVAPEFREARASAGLVDVPEVRVINRASDLDVALDGSRVLLEAGVRLHSAVIHRVDRIWISHAPVLVGNTDAAMHASLDGFTIAARYEGDTFVVTQFERV